MKDDIKACSEIFPYEGVHSNRVGRLNVVVVAFDVALFLFSAFAAYRVAFTSDYRYLGILPGTLFFTYAGGFGWRVFLHGKET